MKRPWLALCLSLISPPSQTEGQRKERYLNRMIPELHPGVFPKNDVDHYGATEEGCVVTFSRGGSDITGSLVFRTVF